MLLSEPPRTAWDLNFSVFGIPVRVHPMFWLVSLLLGTGGTEGEPTLILYWIVAVFISILVHELGHAFAARAHGWEPWITLYGMGGLASYQPTRQDPRSQIFISFAGPAAGFALAAAIVGSLRAAGHDFPFRRGGLLGFELYVPELASPLATLFTAYMLYINIFWGLVNLLPIYPLDGGQISRELFHLYGGSDSLRTSLWLSVFTAAGVAVYGGVERDFYLALFFGYLAYSSYAMLQAYFGPGGGFGGRWR